MDLIDRKELLKKQTVYYDYNGEKVGVVRVSDIVEAPEVKAPEPEQRYDEWCTDCKEYDRERHCCPRWNRVIGQALKDARMANG